jgi:hypothetical protein
MAALAALLRHRPEAVLVAEAETNIILKRQEAFLRSLSSNGEIIVSIIGGPTLQGAKESIMNRKAVRFIVTQTPVRALERMIGNCKWKNEAFNEHTYPHIFNNALEINVYFSVTVLAQVSAMTRWNLPIGGGRLSPNYKKTPFIVEFSQEYNAKTSGIKGMMRIKNKKI